MEAALREAGIPAERASLVASALPVPLPTDKRLLMDGLKVAGVDKMGQRLKAAALLLHLPPSSRESVLAASKQQAPAGSEQQTSSSDDFWRQISEQSATSTEAAATGVVVGGAAAEADPELTFDPLPSEPEVSPAPIAAASTATADLRAAEATAAATSQPQEQQSVERLPTFEERPADERAAVYRQCGNTAYGTGDVRGAARFYEQALALQPGQPELLNNLAACALAATPPEPRRALRILRPLLPAAAEAEAGAEAAARAAATATTSRAALKAMLRTARCRLLLGELSAARDLYASSATAASAAVAAARGADTAAAAVAVVADAETLRQQAAAGQAATAALLAHERSSRACAARRELDGAVAAAAEVARGCACSGLGAWLHVEALVRCGRLVEAHQQAEAALRAAAAVAAPPRGDVRLRVSLARVLARRGGPAEAATMLRGAAEEGAAAAEGGAAAEDEMEEEAARWRTEARRWLGGLEEALSLKEAANAAYGRGEAEEAERLYTAALSADVGELLTPTLRSNRAQARLVRRSGGGGGGGGRGRGRGSGGGGGGRNGGGNGDGGDDGEQLLAAALGDADEAVALDGGSVRHLLRRAACFAALLRPADAAADFRAVLALEPDNAAALAGAARALEREAELRRESDRAGFDPYEVLGLTHDASYTQVKQAFRQQALALHPDKQQQQQQQGGDGAAADREAARRKFERVSAAHAILADKFKRWQLDDGADVEALAKQRQRSSEMAYYATSAPSGFTRDTKTMNVRTGGRTYSPFAKPSANFEVDPCRGSLADTQPQGQLAGEAPIRLKHGGAQLLR